MARVELSFLLSPYYILHTMALSSWLLVRLLVLRGGSPSIQEAMARWEWQTAIAFFMTTALKLWQSPTVEAFLGRTFLYGQLVVLLLTWTLDVRLFAWYCVLFAVLFFMCPQPMYSGPEEVVHVLTQRSLEEIITNGGKGTTWLVFIYAHWSPQCAQLSRIFSDLSVRYSHSALKFGQVDVGRWPGVALLCGVDTSLFTSSLPTFILLEDGEEAARLPLLAKDGTTKAADFSQSSMARVFELDMRRVKSRSRSGGPPRRRDALKGNSQSHRNRYW